MLPMALPDIEVLRSLLDYDPATGLLLWKPRSGDSIAVRKWNTRWSGKPAGTPVAHGHRLVRINAKPFYAHRLAWKMLYGEEPPRYIDHINGDPSDNRATNLRAATQSQNMANAARKRGTRSGEKGVKRNRSRWMASVKAHGRVHHVGTFDTIAEAKAARDAKARELHGEFFNPG